MSGTQHTAYSTPFKDNGCLDDLQVEAISLKGEAPGNLGLDGKSFLVK